MKKLSILVITMLTTLAVMAEGYQVNLQSAKQAGMGHTGAALKLGAESMHFNPAGLGFMDKTIDLSIGGSGVFSSVTAERGGKTFKTDNPVSTPLFVYAGFKIYDNLSAGISLTTPYGSTMDWGKTWAGAGLVQDITLKSFSIQPTVSYKITDKLSIGAGAMIMTGNFSLSRALIPAGALNGYAVLSQVRPYLSAPNQAKVDQVMGGVAAYGDIPAASATLSGNAGLKVGFNVGVMYDINDQWTVGVSYRSKVMMDVNEGKAVMDYANKTQMDAMVQNISDLKPAVDPIIQSMDPTKQLPLLIIPPLDKGTFTASLPLPANLNIGVSYKPNNRWTVTAEGQIVFWSAYKQLVVKFDQNVLGGYSIVADKLYENTVILRAGAQFAATKRLDLRFGAYFDQSPVKKEYLNPETPSMNKLGITAGASFRPTDRLSVDLALSYVTGFGRDGSYPTGPNTPPFSAHYLAKAFTPSLGISYSF